MSLQGPRKRNGSRTRRYVAATIVFLSLALIAIQVFLNQTSVGSPRFVRSTLLLCSGPERCWSSWPS